MAKKQCGICGAEIGLLAYKIEFTDGRCVCKNCTSKAGIQTNDISGISFDMIKDWTEDSSKGTAFFEERERSRLETERIEREKKEEAARIENEKREEERKRQEEQKRIEEEARKKAAQEAEERRLKYERERFPEGRVYAEIVQISWTDIGAALAKGNMLNVKLQDLQDRGCQIMNVTCYTSGGNNNYVQAVIVYRRPPV